MNKEKYGVHIAHCCYIHGCKYGDEDCPVVSGEVAQKYLCYYCDEEDEPYILEEIELLRKTKSYRPTYEQLKNKIAKLEAKLAESKEQVEIVEKQHSELLMTIFDGHKENFELKQQLAEKEKLLEINERILRGTKLVKQELEQDKISFCVEKLEKLDEFIKSGYCFDLFDVRNEIDNQIKAIKGEK